MIPFTLLDHFYIIHFLFLFFSSSAHHLVIPSVDLKSDLGRSIKQVKKEEKSDLGRGRKEKQNKENGEGWDLLGSETCENGTKIKGNWEYMICGFRNSKLKFLKNI